MLKLTRNARYSFLLESVEGGAVRGRYSIIGMKPDVIWRVDGSKASINRRALLRSRRSFEPICLSRRCKRSRTLLAESRIPLCPRTRRPCRQASSAISATTWCA